MVQMAISFQLEGDLEEQLRRDLGDLNLAAKEALLIEAYRQGKLSIGRLARTLGIGVLEADQWLAERAVPLNYTFEDFQADVRTLETLRNRASR
jgi:predicted HTH domain antitoxin